MVPLRTRQERVDLWPMCGPDCIGRDRGRMDCRALALPSPANAPRLQERVHDIAGLGPPRCIVAATTGAVAWRYGHLVRLAARPVVQGGAGARLLVVTLLAIGLAEPMLASGSGAGGAVFVVDRSDSIGEEHGTPRISGCKIPWLLLRPIDGQHSSPLGRSRCWPLRRSWLVVSAVSARPSIRASDDRFELHRYRQRPWAGASATAQRRAADRPPLGWWRKCRPSHRPGSAGGTRGRADRRGRHSRGQ